MKIILLMNIFILSLTSSFSQNCTNTQLSKVLMDKKVNDSVYKFDIQQRIEYYSTLSKEILPKYFKLKTEVLNVVKNSDLKDVLEFKEVYDRYRLGYLSQMRNNQKRLYKNVNAYSKLNSIILFETLDVFPDSYAIIFNSHFNDKKEYYETLRNKVYKNYNQKLKEFKYCFNQMKLEMKKEKTKLSIVEVGQNKGFKTKEDSEKSDLLDFLIWVLK